MLDISLLLFFFKREASALNSMSELEFGCQGSVLYSLVGTSHFSQFIRREPRDWVALRQAVPVQAVCLYNVIDITRYV